ncbi:HEAT repeat domain-containing protein [Nocardiopsis ganjiahuensis]|uniref:HEAT repeat domain-containing protein n=1 Tax=Nocardiopsis ganjiahuensis TaxID=239984 RepID=UPI000346817F|nr:HEAT repeat domain-containing protein [Nocardiopsis ganjiahuensis]
MGHEDPNPWLGARADHDDPNPWLGAGTDHGDPHHEFGAGTDHDVRVLVEWVHREPAPRMEYTEVPWGRFHHAGGPAEDVPDLLARIRSSDPRNAARALALLHHAVRHQSTVYPPAALAVPFLLRIAAAPSTHHRADVLWLAAKSGRTDYHGSGLRTDLLKVTDPPEQWVFDSRGYPMNWSVQAARQALAANVHTLRTLLADPDAQVRCLAGYALSAVLSGAEDATDALRGRLRAEEVPEVRISLVLAIGQLAREHHDRAGAVDWTRELWSSPEQTAETRLGAALAWLALTEEAVPDRLLTILTRVMTPAAVDAMSRVPWTWDFGTADTGVYLCLTRMLGVHARRVLGERTQELAEPEPWG